MDKNLNTVKGSQGVSQCAGHLSPELCHTLSMDPNGKYTKSRQNYLSSMLLASAGIDKCGETGVQKARTNFNGGASSKLRKKEAN